MGDDAFASTPGRSGQPSITVSAARPAPLDRVADVTLRVEVLDGDGNPVDAGFAVDIRWRDADLGRIATVTAVASREHVGNLRVSLDLEDAPDPWWLIPGAFYGENRPGENGRVFPRFERGARTPEQHAAFTSDAWEFRSDRAATPAVLAWGGPDRPGAALAVDPETALGLTGLGLAHHAPDTATLHATFPFREGPVSYFGDREPRPAEVTTHRFAPGERIELRVRVFELGADRHDYAPVLRALWAESAASAPLRPWVGVDEAAELAAEGLVRWHYDPDPGVLLETVGFDRELSGRDGQRVDRQAMHVGWVSGIPWATALLQHGARVGDAAASDAARRVIDFATAELSPSGTFWGVWYRGTGWTQSWTSIRGGLHARTLGEAALFLARALEVEPDHPRWEQALRSNLDAIVTRQRADGNLGTVHDAESGEVRSWTGSAGLTWVAALVAARDRDERYLPAAVRAGEYYARFVAAEFLHGAPEDVDLAPTSEDGYLAVMSYLALHEATGEPRWLDLARRAADWMLTFRYSYDVSFDPRTILGVYDFGTRGADQASSSNQHLHAYGLICTRELRALSAALGDPYYATRADETLACFRQFVARFDGDFNAYRGMVSERFYQTACFQPKGMLLTLSHAWSVGVLLLACEQTLADA